MTNTQIFIDKIAPIAQQDMNKTSILSSLTMAQCILESGWGKSELAMRANNYFGIKGNYNGCSYKVKTKEFVNGIWTEIYADFKKYPTILECFNDHSNKFLTMDRYKKLRGEKDYKKACKYVHEAGYATAPDYSQALINIIEKYKLYQNDKRSDNMTTICIDPGHCDKFSGSGKGAQREEKDTLKLSLKVEEYLRSYGHLVYLTRRTGESIDDKNSNADLNARPAFANKIKADYFLSIHRNSHSNTTARGNEIWVHSEAKEKTTKIAQQILDNVNKVAATPNRGLKKGYTGGAGDYAVNRLSNMSSALLELGFISNDEDNMIFNSNIEAYAQAIAKGICQGMNINYQVIKPAYPTNPVQPNTPPAERTCWLKVIGNRLILNKFQSMLKTFNLYSEFRGNNLWIGAFKKSVDTMYAINDFLKIVNIKTEIIEV